MELLERDQPLAAFAGALRDAAAGRGRALLVRGEPGIGKTALVRHALQTVAAGARVLAAGCDDLATARPLGPFRDLADRVGDELATLLRDGAGVDELFDPLVRELQRPPRPVVLAVDDAHWADDATLDLLAFLLRRLDQVPALVVVTHRTGLDAHHPLRAVTGRIPTEDVVHVDLRPLSPDGVARLGDHPDPRALWRRTGGNPFLATALAGHHDEGVPPTVQAAVLAELADLDAPERALVELAAVVPTCVEAPLLDACRPGWEEHGARPELRGVLELRDGAVAFRHELARQAVFSSLPAARRRALHREVLGALVDRGGDPARVVHHAVGADDVETLVAVGPAAARAAARSGAHRQALEHLRRLVVHEDRFPLAERAQLWDDHGSELLTADDPVAARSAWRHALELYEQLGDLDGQARATGFLASCAWIGHDPAGAHRFGDREVALLEEAGRRGTALARAYVNRSGRHMAQWEFARAEQAAHDALAISEPGGHDVPTAHALIMGGTSMVTRGELDEGLAWVDRGMAVAQRVEAWNLVSLAYGNAAEALLDRRRPDLAARYVERGLDFADHHETLSVGGYLAGVHARLLAVRAEWDDALDAARPVWAGGRLEAVNQVVAGLAAARVLVRRGERTDEAVAVAREILDLRWEPQYHAPAAALLAEAAWLVGDDPPAVLDEVLPMVRATGQGWAIGELESWRHRFGRATPDPHDLPEPHARALSGDPIGASAAWQVRGHPYERLLVLHASDDVPTVRDAVEAADLLGVPPLADRLRGRLRELGVQRIPRGPQPTTRENPGGLTDRQLEVLRHVAAGRTNVEIAQVLVLSVRTVDHHVSAALGKLGVATRHEAAELAVELGVTPAD